MSPEPIFILALAIFSVCTLPVFLYLEISLYYAKELNDADSSIRKRGIYFNIFLWLLVMIFYFAPPLWKRGGGESGLVYIGFFPFIAIFTLFFFWLGGIFVSYFYKGRMQGFILRKRKYDDES